MTDYAVEYGESTGADEVTVKLREENKHQIRFSKSSINVNKEWETYTVDIFMSKGHRFSLGKRINTLTIQDPDEEEIKRRVPKQIRLLKDLPKSKLYWGIDEGSYYDYPNIPNIYDERIEDFPEKAPKLVEKMIQASQKAGANTVSGVMHFSRSKIGVLTGYGNGGTYKESDLRTTIRSYHDKTSSGQGLEATRDLDYIEKNV
ncbi:MAG: hypothetical protein ACOCSL_01040 [Thermoplasmatota archaeon]